MSFYIMMGYLSGNLAMGCTLKGTMLELSFALVPCIYVHFLSFNVFFCYLIWF